MTTTAKSLSRRGFVQILGAGAAAAALRLPASLAAATTSAAPVKAKASAKHAAGEVVRLSSNENPYG
ncbi:MAG TPA: hypothetical protein VGQ28_00300, partial [Thermoanaerobaculia bacterium]|nr:hypothetical protein [Thermoanaerobaculia bacterium]